MQEFNKLNIEDFNEKTFNLIDKEWMLIAAGDRNRYNMMTASWGTLGILWHKPIAIVFVRPTRYTFEFMEKHEYFSLNFFEEKHRKILQFCGSKSGRDYDKSRETGLIPEFTDNGTVYFNQARMVMVCKKLYADDLNPNKFHYDFIEKNYPKKDYHRFYIGEIVQYLVK